MMLLGASPNSNQPLILRRGSVPCRGFLEGRTKGDRCVLLLHLFEYGNEVARRSGRQVGFNRLIFD